ncbi:MAG TPA: twin-arginine translocase subunit TatC [Candidatus Limnocylindrales bacterium]|nr:twin-arginine translocase subunit TatC [Candidatus Limnocylindrales bacterium]
MADAEALRGAGVAGSGPDPAAPAAPAGPPAVPPAPSSGGAAPDEASVMSLVGHLTELRSRIVRIAIAILGGSVVGFYFAGTIIEILAKPAGGRLLNLAPGDAFFIYVRVAVVTGIVIAMPVILYQIWQFVAPGLTIAERRTVRPWVPLALAFFALGVTIAYIVLPYAMAFLLSFGTGTFVNELAAAPYFNFVTTLFLAFGLVMEFPILLFGLSRVGILTSERLRGSRRPVILGISIFSAVVTPGGDLVSPFVLGVTMYILFEATIVAIRRSGR